MPNRYIRESILGSKRVAATTWAEEVFYRRLMSIVDDYGRCEADPINLRASLYPRQLEKVSAADVETWMTGISRSEVGLCKLYSVEGKAYIQIENFGQKERSKSKCPSPPASASKCPQVLADANICSLATNSNSSTNANVEDDNAQGRSQTPIPSKFDPRLNPPKCADVKRIAEQYGVLMSEKDINDFLDHWSALGWETKAGLIRDWRPKVRKWHETGKEIALQKRTPGQSAGGMKEY